MYVIGTSVRSDLRSILGLLQHSLAHPPCVLHPHLLQLLQDGRQPWEDSGHHLPTPNTHQGVGRGEVRGKKGDLSYPLVQLGECALESGGGGSHG